MREWFAPQRHFQHPGELTECPYGDPPEVEIQSETEWTIDGKPKDIINDPCAYIVRDPHACNDCPLNPYVAEENSPTASPFLAFVLRVERLQDTGAAFPFDALSSLEWKALGMLKIERQKADLREMKEKQGKK